MQGPRSAILLLLLFISYSSYAQAQPDKAAAITNFLSRFFNKIEHRITGLDDQLTHKTAKYLERMRRREQRMYHKLYKKDSAAAKALFGGYNCIKNIDFNHHGPKYKLTEKQK